MAYAWHAPVFAFVHPGAPFFHADAAVRAGWRMAMLAPDELIGALAVVAIFAGWRVVAHGSRSLGGTTELRISTAHQG